MANKIQVSALIPAIRKHIGQGYVYGSVGQTCTVRLLKAKQAQYGKKMGEGYYQKGGNYEKGLCARWLGKWVADCVGLIKGTSRDLGGIYRDVSANGIYGLCSVKGRIAGMPRIPGVLVFMNKRSDGDHPAMCHVGVYEGGGKTIESAGVLSGVIERKLSKKWTHYGILSNWFLYDLPDEGTGEIAEPAASGNDGDGSAGQADDPAFDTGNVPWLNRGDRGESVEYLQETLAAKGAKLSKSLLKIGKYDGVFGPETDAAVHAFQKTNGLEADGIAGPKTWSALLGVECK